MDFTILLILYTFTLASSIKVKDSNEDTVPEQSNTTKLLPIIPQEAEESNPSSESTVWKLDTSYGESGEIDKNVTEKDTSIENPGNGTKIFKPSTHLGNIIEGVGFSKPEYGFAKPEDGFAKPEDGLAKPEYGYYDSYGEVIKRPAAGFQSPTTTKGFDWNYETFPYRIEAPILTQAMNNIWRPNAVSEYKPTDKPYDVPAGGLYQLQDPFREKPADTEEQFGLQFQKDVKDAIVKKRMNPWKDLMRLITAFIPVGIIISALTPNIITIENTGGYNHLGRG